MTISSVLLVLFSVTCASLAWRSTVTETYRIGPYTVPANKQKRGWELNVPKPSGEVAIISMAARVTDIQGNTIPPTTVYLHHVLLQNVNGSLFTCMAPDGFAPPALIAAWGGDMTTFNLPYPYFVRSQPGEVWAVAYHFVNNQPQDYQVVFEYIITYLHIDECKAQSPDNQLFNGYILYYDIVPICNANFDVPGGGMPPVYVQSNTFEAQYDMVIPFAVGHLHRGGEDITLSVGGSVLCDSVPTVGDGGYITRMQTCYPNASIKAGDVLQVVAVYNNSQPLNGTMGIFLAFGYIPNFNTTKNTTVTTTDDKKNTVDLSMPALGFIIFLCVGLFVGNVVTMCLWRRAKAHVRRLQYVISGDDDPLGVQLHS